MKQSRRASFIEAWGNVVIGFVIQWVMAFTVLHVMELRITVAQNFYLAIVMTVVSLARSYLLRRFFEHLRVKGVLK